MLNPFLVKNAIGWLCHALSIDATLVSRNGAFEVLTFVVTRVPFNLPPEFFGPGKADIRDLEIGMNAYLGRNRGERGELRVRIRRRSWLPSLRSHTVPIRLDTVVFEPGPDGIWLAQVTGTIEGQSPSIRGQWSNAGLTLARDGESLPEPLRVPDMPHWSLMRVVAAVRDRIVGLATDGLVLPGDDADHALDVSVECTHRTSAGDSLAPGMEAELNYQIVTQPLQIELPAMADKEGCRRTPRLAVRKVRVEERDGTYLVRPIVRLLDLAKEGGA